MEVLFQGELSRDREKLLMLLEACRESAEEDEHFKIASICLEVSHLDPLAVLESIFESSEHHFYVERPSDGIALAGADAIAACTAEGPERFSRASAFAQEVFAHTFAVGALEAPFSGPHVFGAFSFLDDGSMTGSKRGVLEQRSAFAPATLFVPRWQVACENGRYTAVANIRIEPDSQVEELADRVLAAYDEFTEFNYDEAQRPDPSGTPFEREEVGSPAAFQSAVSEALRRIEAEQFDKIVLARALDLWRPGGFLPLRMLARLRERFPGCYAFSFSNETAASFIGATPERLLRVKDGAIFTEAIAGSARRGADASEDAGIARGLLGSEKDLREHAHVVESILRRLRQAGVPEARCESCRLLPLANVQHLHTPIRAQLLETVSLFDLLAALHPTPAVGGTPREAAVNAIPELEPFARELYAGCLGWINARGEGEWVVGIRSARVLPEALRVYAGAGIVAGSDPAREHAETEMKLRAILEALR